jgi:hypothetical protein
MGYDDSVMADVDGPSRATDDVYKLVFGLYEVWVSKKGRLKPPVKVNGVGWGHDGVRWMTDLKVPGYWKIPCLQAKKLQLLLELEITNKPPFAENLTEPGGVSRPSSDPPCLKITIRKYKESGWGSRIISNLGYRLKGCVAHELQHFLDEETRQELIKRGVPYRPANFATKGAAAIKSHWDYLADPMEVRAKVRQVVEKSKAARKPLKQLLDNHLRRVRQIVLRQSEDEAATNEMVENLRKLYVGEYLRMYHDRSSGI